MVHYMTPGTYAIGSVTVEPYGVKLPEGTKLVLTVGEDKYEYSPSKGVDSGTVVYMLETWLNEMGYRTIHTKTTEFIIAKKPGTEGNKVNLSITFDGPLNMSVNAFYGGSDFDFYKTKDSLSVASVDRLTLSNDEFREYCKDLEGQVKKLGLKVKRLQSVSQTATITEYPVKTIIRDSIIPGKTDTLRCINFQNAYLTLSGCFESSHFNGLVENRDTIIQVIHRVPHRFWFIRWGTKAIRQEIISQNPYSRISYTEYIELKK